MIVVLQRVARAAIAIDGADIASIGRGLCLLTCALADDTDDELDWLAGKIASLRVFPDAAGATNLDLAQAQGAVLVVPQFTLAADWRRGRRPSFTGAAGPAPGRRLVERFVAALAARGCSVTSGGFGRQMEVALVNDGPFTLVLDSRHGPRGGAAPPP